MKQKYIIYILVLATLVVVYFFILNKSKQKTFKESFQHAKDHIKNIDTEINNSQKIINKAKLRLDSIEEDINLIEKKKQKNIETMQATTIKLERLVDETKNEIILLSEKYATLNDKKNCINFS